MPGLFLSQSNTRRKLCDMHAISPKKASKLHFDGPFYRFRGISIYVIVLIPSCLTGTIQLVRLRSDILSDGNSSTSLATFSVNRTRPGTFAFYTHQSPKRLTIYNLPNLIRKTARNTRVCLNLFGENPCNIFRPTAKHVCYKMLVAAGSQFGINR